MDRRTHARTLPIALHSRLLSRWIVAWLWIVISESFTPLAHSLLHWGCDGGGDLTANEAILSQRFVMQSPLIAPLNPQWIDC